MNSENKEYLNEYIYDYISDLCEASEKYKELSGNLKDRLSELFDTIDDEDCNEILCDIDEINRYLIKLNSLSKNEFTMIMNNGKLLISKYTKHKEKIMSLKSKNKMLEEELSVINEQKENAFKKIDELNDEYYKLYQEKNNLEIQMSIKEEEKNKKHKADNEILNDEIDKLNDKIKYLNNQINTSEEKIKNLSKNNREYNDIISQMKKELVNKNELIKINMEKSNKLNEEKEKIRCINRGLEKTVEDLKTQCKDYQTIINFNEEKINQLNEKINKLEIIKDSKTINFESLEFDEEKAKENNKNEDLDEKNLNRRNAIDYTGIGKEINLNELIFEESESAEQEAIEKKNKIKLALTRVKCIRRFNKLKSLNYNIKHTSFEANDKKHKSRKNVLFQNLDSIEEIKRPKNGRLKTIGNKKILIKLGNLLNSRDEYNCKNDEKFLYEFLFSYIDY